MVKKSLVLLVTLLVGVSVILTACQRQMAQNDKPGTIEHAINTEETEEDDAGSGILLGRPASLPKASGSSTPDDSGSSEPDTTEPATPVPSIPVEDLMEYDWIIRTPGVCEQVFVFEGGVKFTAQFSLMAIKFGGYTGSSLPVYNDGDHNPYVGYVSFSLKQSMKGITNQIGIEHLQGTGGISLDAFNSDARFYVDSPADDGTRTIITIETLSNAVVDPTIHDYYQDLVVGVEFLNTSMPMPLDIRIEPAGEGYQLVLLNMKPGGGDIRFPAMLEKIPLSDIDKAERERIKKEQDEEALRKARELQKKVLEDWKKELSEKLENESDDPSREGDVTSQDISPGDEGSLIDDIIIWPLVPDE